MKVVTIDEAIDILENYKKKGEKNILVSVYSEDDQVSNLPYKADIKHGIKIIKSSIGDIIYNQSILDAIYTRNGTKRKTILFPN